MAPAPPDWKTASEGSQKTVSRPFAWRDQTLSWFAVGWLHLSAQSCLCSWHTAGPLLKGRRCSRREAVWKWLHPPERCSLLCYWTLHFQISLSFIHICKEACVQVSCLFVLPLLCSCICGQLCQWRSTWKAGGEEAGVSFHQLPMASPPQEDQAPQVRLWSVTLILEACPAVFSPCSSSRGMVAASCSCSSLDDLKIFYRLLHSSLSWNQFAVLDVLITSS